MAKIKHKDKKRRKNKYDMLRAEGFTSIEANRYKDMSDGKIDNLIRTKRDSIIALGRIAGDN